jgi:hypothetical protein
MEGREEWKERKEALAFFFLSSFSSIPSAAGAISTLRRY